MYANFESIWKYENELMKNRLQGKEESRWEKGKTKTGF